MENLDYSIIKSEIQPQFKEMGENLYIVFYLRGFSRPADNECVLLFFFKNAGRKYFFIFFMIFGCSIV
ncbi:MAG: hypothetical protein D6785_04490 [Planctomycetota bacterium]|nr:MAG: hypothetical protein D6785_04490 [Planctomycetota bacterium]